ncbi:zinc uptake protein ZrgA [Vibrio paucivorans]
MNTKTPLAALIGLALSTSVFAEEGFRQHDAHAHGHVELNIVQDGNELLMEFTAPGADVVGFEHAPKNEEQKALMSDTIAKLEQANNVITLTSAANCHIETASVSHTLGGDDHSDHDHNHDHDHDHDHDHEKHDHHDDHDNHGHHDKHDDHGHHDKHDDHGHHDHDEHHDGHGSFTVEYHYHCDNLDKLKSIDTQWFNHFPTTESISVNLLTDNAQTATKLSKGNASISL